MRMSSRGPWHFRLACLLWIGFWPAVPSADDPLYYVMSPDGEALPSGAIEWADDATLPVAGGR
jgi:hypothetical protein